MNISQVQVNVGNTFLRNGTIVIFDLEWTSWSGFRENNWSLPGKHREIIQIGAVKIDCEQNFSEVGHFDQLVKPKYNPVLSTYIKDLTGLSQNQIDAGGLAFPQALASFFEFCQTADHICSNGTDSFVINENCELHKIDPPTLFSKAVNLNPMLSSALGITDGGIYSCELTTHLGLPSEGDHHNGLADARGIASAIRHLLMNHQI